jgi:uncharacterized damage-inducible protein DinB
MPESDPLQILLSHDRWATTQLLDACGKLSADQFHQRFDIGPGSLHDALTHIVGAMRAWTDNLVGVEQRPRLETDGQRRTPEQLRSMLDEAHDAFAAEARRRPLEEMVTRQLKDGRTIHLTRGAVLTHVTTHGMHHRAQCLNMFRRLAVSPLPPSSVTEWTWLGDTRM